MLNKKRKPCEEDMSVSFHFGIHGLLKTKLVWFSVFQPR